LRFFTGPEKKINKYMLKKKFEDTKGVIRCHNLKDRKNNGQKKRGVIE
jgi:hypothetical protein